MYKQNYVLFTPLKNEEKTIKRVVDSVKEQSVKPLLWIIVNDGSTDKSLDILEKETFGVSWIKVVSKTINREYNWLGYSKVIKEAEKTYNTFKGQRFNDKDIDYVGILDSDITIEKQFFEKLIVQLNADPKLGVVSGEVLVQIGENKEWIAERAKSKKPRGGARLYKYNVYKLIGGFPETPSPDLVSDIKIERRGYKCEKYAEAKAYQHRKTFGKQSWNQKCYSYGIGKYILGYTFLHMIFVSIVFGMREKPVVISGVCCMLGYIKAFIRQEKQVGDKEIREYSKDFVTRFAKGLVKSD